MSSIQKGMRDAGARMTSTRYNAKPVVGRLIIGKQVLGAALAAAVTLSVGGWAGPASADEAKADVDLGDVFGQSPPSDTLGAGQREFAHEIVGGFGRNSGRYTLLEGKTQLGFGLGGVAEAFSITPGLLSSYASIKDVDGLPNHDGISVTGLAVEFKALVLDRNKTGLGVALLAEPTVGWIDGETGDDIRSRGSEFHIAADWAVVPAKLFASAQVVYGLDRTTTDGITAKSSDLSFIAAAAYRVTETFFLGAELRYIRSYEGLGLDALQGEAIYLGPTVFWQPNEKIAITATWSPQVWGRDATGAGSASDLDLTNFERHQAKLKVAIPF